MSEVKRYVFQHIVREGTSRSLKKKVQQFTLAEDFDRVTAERDSALGLSVTKIMLDIVPGYEGMGEEVYAKSVEDVEHAFTRLYDEVERLTDQRDALQALLTAADERADALVSALTLVTDGGFDSDTGSGSWGSVRITAEDWDRIKAAQSGGQDWQAWAVGNTVRYQGSGQDGEDCYCRMTKGSDYLIHEAPDDHESMLVLDDDGDELCVLVGEFKWIKP